MTGSYNLALRDFAERTLSTFVQVYLAVVLASIGTIEDARVPWVDAFFVALFATAVAVVTSVVKNGAGLKITSPMLDLAYRTALTFAQTLLGLMVAAGTIGALSFDWPAAIRLSLIAAAGALLKGLAGLNNNQTLGASTFVARRD